MHSNYLPSSTVYLFEHVPRTSLSGQQSMATTLPCTSYKTEMLESPLLDLIYITYLANEVSTFIVMEPCHDQLQGHLQ